MNESRPLIERLTSVSIATALLVAFLESSSIHQRASHQLIHIVIVCRWWAISTEGLRFVFDDVLVSRDGQRAFRVNTFAHHRATIDLGAVTTVEVADEPVALFQGQATMLGGYVREFELDIGFPATANHETLFHQRDRIASAGGSKLPQRTGEYLFVLDTHDVFSIIRCCEIGIYLILDQRRRVNVRFSIRSVAGLRL